jgi:arylsulfatase
MDIAPTLLEMAGVQHPASNGKNGTYKDHEVYPMRGKSWVPFMNASAQGGVSGIHGDDDFMGWELFGRAALRKGQWKIVNMPEDAFGKTSSFNRLTEISSSTVTDQRSTRQAATAMLHLPML